MIHKRALKYYLIFLYILIIFMSFFYSLNAGETKKIMIVHSYNHEYDWIKEYTSGLKSGFKKYGLDNLSLLIREFYMEAYIYPERLKDRGKEAYNLYRSFNPDLIIAADDAAQKYFIVPYISRKTKTPVVFLGVNAEPSIYGYPSTNVTGVVERANFNECLSLVHILCPEARTFGLLSDESLTSMSFLAREKIERNKLYGPLKLKVIYATKNFEEWKSNILRLQNEVDVVFLVGFFSLKDKEGNPVNPDTALRWYLNNNKRPETTPVLFSVQNGVLCSFAESGYIQGLEASRIIAEVLINKKSISDIPVLDPKRGIRVINKTRAKQLVIDIPPELVPGTKFYD